MFLKLKPDGSWQNGEQEFGSFEGKGRCECRLANHQKDKDTCIGDDIL
jgi:hypothetical protein